MLEKLKLIKDTYGNLCHDELLQYHLLNAHNLVSFKRNDILLAPGQILKEYYIIESGYVRSYVHDLEGQNVTTEFFKYGDIAMDVVSLFQSSPSQMGLQAISEVTCLRLDLNAFLNLYKHYPTFNEWGRQWMTTEYHKLRSRTIGMIMHPAMQRYLEFIKDKPDIHNIVPLKYIASYLGVTDTSLSRLRRKKMVWSENNAI